MYSGAYGNVYTYPREEAADNPRYIPPDGDHLYFIARLMKSTAMPKYFILIINPEDAARLASKGWKTKEDIRQWIWENATMTYKEWRANEPWWSQPGHSYTSSTTWKAHGIDPKTVTDETTMHLPLYGKEHFHIVHLGTGTPIPTFARGDHCATVSIDKWR
ncbi:MAG: hypothetical protein NTV30_01965, partial [Chloroflexi bacterium]|nr:hypothetical protein [Chloroflexota bacterium]